MKNQISETFRQILHAIHPINAAEWEILSENITVKEIKKNSFIHVPGDSISSFVFLINGAIRLYFMRNGKEYTHQIYTSQRFIIDVIALRTEQPTDYYMEALTNCWIIEISTNFMSNLLLLSPTFENVSRMMYENAVLEEMCRVKELLSLSPFEQYTQFMNAHKELANQLTQVKTASCLNITQETFSRFKRMSQ